MMASICKIISFSLLLMFLIRVECFTYSPFLSRKYVASVHSKPENSILVLKTSEGNVPNEIMQEMSDSVCKVPDPATTGFIMQQTMIRIKDPKASLDFYTRILGMSLLTAVHFEEWKFSLYFVGFANPKDVPEDKAERAEWCMKQPGTIELTHNWGTENDPDFEGYHNGNDKPQGFGHIGVTVPDVYAACSRFEEFGVQFRKKPDEGGMKGLAFILDPDGYSIEILSATTFRADFTKYCSDI